MTLKGDDILNLPDAPDFVSESPKYTVTEMAKICEKMLPYWNKLRYSKSEPEFLGPRFELVD